MQLCSYATQTLDLSVNHITKRQKGISTPKNKNKMPSTIQMAATWGACPVVGKQPGPNLMLVAIIHVGQNMVCPGLEYRLERMSQGLDHSRGMHGASLPVGCWFFFFFPFHFPFPSPFLFPFSLLCFNEPDLELASHRFPSSLIVLWPIW
ncbi:hypothetical protein P167DRAFT_161708 [Morchella conica CCBAS932]|uniref:Uncharacterized protein n=1 Tax=Morchella conica CCBAS932 TaxID=1392247 RepID=A0A3N4KSW3_9PEZI|nr:hypothetical protein P167DRAFT_161708 [Morchella conica CCBAS932]